MMQGRGKIEMLSSVDVRETAKARQCGSRPRFGRGGSCDGAGRMNADGGWTDRGGMTFAEQGWRQGTIVALKLIGVSMGC